MKYVKQSCIIFGITMMGELLNALLPLPVPAGVYGLFLLLVGLCMGVIKLGQVEETGNASHVHPGHCKPYGKL